jgi:DNA-binding CsgD family transcriptional regulator
MGFEDALQQVLADETPSAIKVVRFLQQNPNSSRVQIMRALGLSEESTRITTLRLKEKKVLYISEYRVGTVGRHTPLWSVGRSFDAVKPKTVRDGKRPMEQHLADLKARNETFVSLMKSGKTAEEISVELNLEIRTVYYKAEKNGLSFRKLGTVKKPVIAVRRQPKQYNKGLSHGTLQEEALTPTFDTSEILQYISGFRSVELV